MNRRCRTGHIVNSIDFDLKRINHIVTNKFEIGIIFEMSNVMLIACKEIIQANDFVPLFEQTFTNVTTKETGSSCY